MVVLNHDSLALFKDLYKYTDKNVVLIANISNTPWIIKQLAVNEKLEGMYKESKIPLINDSNGAFINSLGLNDNTQNKYFVYKLNIDGTIVKTNEGFVELNILEKGISPEEFRIKFLKPIDLLINILIAVVNNSDPSYSKEEITETVINDTFESNHWEGPVIQQINTIRELKTNLGLDIKFVDEFGKIFIRQK